MKRLDTIHAPEAPEATALPFAQRAAPPFAQRAQTPALLRLLGISRSTLYRLLEEPDFPRPAVVGGLRLYDLRAVHEWLRAREARTAEPPQLRGTDKTRRAARSQS